MADIRVSSRYAKSLLSLAVEQNCLEQVAKDMHFIEKVISENKPLLLLLKSPIIKTDKKISILSEILKKIFLRFLSPLLKSLHVKNAR